MVLVLLEDSALKLLSNAEIRSIKKGFSWLIANIEGKKDWIYR